MPLFLNVPLSLSQSPPGAKCSARWAVSAPLGPGEGSLCRLFPGDQGPLSCSGAETCPPQSPLGSETPQQINCSCALEFPQHTNLRDVKQLGGNPSMPWTEAELPMSYGD